jgi:ATP-dependent exoDNAse (exonuclease V) alpha subunit
MKKPLELNSDFQFVLDLLEKTQKNLFITGRAGTGKSTLLHLFRHITRKHCVVLAPTGVAALNVQGQTIHAFFGFPAKFIRPEEIQKRKDTRLYKKMEVLIIDEISMVRADMLDNIDRFLRINRNRPSEPFGGVQMVFFGDLFQLPPIVASPEEQQFFKMYYTSPYFFSAKICEGDGFAVSGKFEMDMFELTKVYRQEARHFIRLLDAVRLGTADWDDLQDLNERYDPQFNDKNYFITLSTRNAAVDALNNSELQRLHSEEYSYHAEVKGLFDPKQFPTEGVLKLKLGAQVMFIKNDTLNREYVNGTIGKVTKLEAEKIMVQIEDRDGNLKNINVERQTWEILRYTLTADSAGLTTDVLGSFTQYPLRLAWAITIHKSQGKTFDKVIIDLSGGAFEVGQTYVALSRCRTLEGIVLKQPIRPNDIRVDERILTFYEKHK